MDGYEITTKVRKAGGKTTSLATTIPREVVAHLQIKEGDEVKWSRKNSHAVIEKS